MAYFRQLKNIIEIDDTADKAIESYGSFVKYTNKLQARVQKSKRKGLSNDTVSLRNCGNEVDKFHEAILKKFGEDTMFKAIRTHPFN
tara:strand:- start:736 stop:996 length:261 start_codon:yes stop_codon:yes gene_type:complete